MGNRKKGRKLFPDEKEIGRKTPVRYSEGLVTVTPPPQPSVLGDAITQKSVPLNDKKNGNDRIRKKYRSSLPQRLPQKKGA